MNRHLVVGELELAIRRIGAWLAALEGSPGGDPELSVRKLWHWTRGAHRLEDGRPLCTRTLLGWRVALLDQLQFELGEHGYEEARVDQAAALLFQWLDHDAPPPALDRARTSESPRAECA